MDIFSSRTYSPIQISISKNIIQFIIFKHYQELVYIDPSWLLTSLCSSVSLLFDDFLPNILCLSETWLILIYHDFLSARHKVMKYCVTRPILWRQSFWYLCLISGRTSDTLKKICELTLFNGIVSSPRVCVKLVVCDLVKLYVSLDKFLRDNLLSNIVLHFPTHPSVYWVVFEAQFENSRLGPLNDRSISGFLLAMYPNNFRDKQKTVLRGGTSYTFSETNLEGRLMFINNEFCGLCWPTQD